MPRGEPLPAEDSARAAPPAHQVIESGQKALVRYLVAFGLALLPLALL